MSDKIDFMFATIADFLKERPQSTEVTERLNELPKSASVIIHTYGSNTIANCWYNSKMLLSIGVV